MLEPGTASGTAGRGGEGGPMEELTGPRDSGPDHGGQGGDPAETPSKREGPSAAVWDRCDRPRAASLHGDHRGP